MNFKLPSLSEFQEGISKSFFRFSLSIISGIIGSISAILMLESSSSKEHIFMNMILVCGLAIPIFYSIKIYFEVKKSSVKLFWITNAIVFLLLVGYYFTLPADVDHFNQDYIRYFLFFIAVHLLVAFIPYVFKQNSPAFWQYNNISFTRIITSSIFSFVLYIGLVLCLVAIDELFNVDIHDELYGEIFFVILGVFNTWYFLGGIPSNLQKLDEVKDYPKVIKVFAQYILLPLVVIYLLILLSYEAKIISLWDFPKGIVSYMILGVSIVGILNILLLHPLIYKRVNWVKKYEKMYFIILIPLIALLYIAIWMRVSEYGITENRYFLIALSLWLNGITFYFLLSKKNKIEIIPISLFVIVTLSSFGPWGTFAVSERSQFNRLQAIFEKYEMVEEGKFQINESKIDDKDLIEISSIVDYLIDYHDIDRINNLLSDEKKIILKDSTRGRWDNENVKLTVESLGFDYKGSTYSTSKYISYLDNNSVYTIEGFTKMIIFDNYQGSTCENNCVDLINSENIIIVKINNIEYELNLTDYVSKLYKKHPESDYKWKEKDSLYFEKDEFKIIFSNFEYRVSSGNKMEINHIKGYVLIKD